MANDEVVFGVTTVRSLGVRSLVEAREVVERHGPEERRERLATFFPRAPETPEEISALQSELISALAELVQEQARASAPRPRGRPRKHPPQDEPATP